MSEESDSSEVSFSLAEDASSVPVVQPWTEDQIELPN
jgi:hypothetical protein